MGGSWIADNQGANNKYQENYDQQYGYREPGPTNAPGETTTRQTVIVGVGQASFHYQSWKNLTWKYFSLKVTVGFHLSNSVFQLYNIFVLKTPTGH